MSDRQSSPSDSPISVLYVDDDEQLLELTREFLETENPRLGVETAASPQRGLELLDRREFDVVVCDYQMPEMDGLAVLETVREERGSDVPFVLFTGKGRKEVAIDALNLGADRYVRKGGDPTAQYGVLAEAVRQEVDHHRTRNRLERREGNLRRVLESIGDAVITTDVDGRITRMNSVAEELTGWTSADAVGRPLPEVFEILNQETRDPEPNPAEKVLDTGRIVGLANGTVLKRRGGSERFIADSAAPIENEDGDVLGVVIVFRDVTDEYRARERQREQRRTVIDLSVDDDISAGDLDRGARTITEAAADALDVDRVGLWLFENGNAVLRNVDLYERATDAHESGAELTASELPDYFDALESHRVVDATDARTDPRTAELRDEYLDRLGITSMLDATVRSGGEVVGVLCHEHAGEPREWTDDELRFAGELADQVLRLLNNRRQRAYEAALKELHDIATDITSYDTRREICRRTVDVAETILDFDLCVVNLEEDGTLPIMAISEDLPPDAATPMSVDEGIAGKTYRAGESFRYDDVQSVDEANPQGPYRAALSVPIGDHGVFQTVSERVGAFDEHDRELAELLVSHAARALDRLEGERELRRRNERLDDFAGIVSHDLRNPLNVAQGRLELAREECESPHLDDVARAHDRMETLIDDLLTLARQGRTATRTGPVDLAETVERCWRNVETEGATLAVDADRDVRADDGLVRQLLENLFRNAVEHGGPDVTVRVGVLEDVSASNASGGSTDESVGGFFVEDDGRGIPPERRTEVFEMGYSTEEGGTGLGLSIVKQVCDAHGWDVTVAEGTDGGTRLEITDVTVLTE
ncbi:MULTISPECIES: GAF domain-containing protein [Halorussus]|uniref:GAF domain-containing protein n=1 Tax=Halorussus TaxID=1070314 RepID=UPI000E213F77|nr:MULTISPECIES: GAF domain-containing protein [Halorussus]NHN58358.1 GAF domain-containing protein [Halorussus sp. JP-T4]